MKKLFHKPACEVFKNGTADKTRQKNKKTVVSECVGAKNYNAAAEAIDRDIGTLQRTSVDEFFVIQGLNGGFVDPAYHGENKKHKDPVVKIY